MRGQDREYPGRVRDWIDLDDIWQNWMDPDTLIFGNTDIWRKITAASLFEVHGDKHEKQRLASERAAKRRQNKYFPVLDVCLSVIRGC